MDEIKKELKCISSSSSSYPVYLAHRKTMDKVLGRKEGDNSYLYRRARPKESPGSRKIWRHSYTRKIN